MTPICLTQTPAKPYVHENKRIYRQTDSQCHAAFFFSCKNVSDKSFSCAPHWYWWRRLSLRLVWGFGFGEIEQGGIGHFCSHSLSCDGIKAVGPSTEPNFFVIFSCTYGLASVCVRQLGVIVATGHTPNAHVNSLIIGRALFQSIFAVAKGQGQDILDPSAMPCPKLFTKAVRF